jgi:cbb3-type cytochrome oxidase maturation protein
VNILFVMIPLALMLLAAAIWCFFWAVRSGQFDDLETQGSLVLFDDDTPASTARAPAPGAKR